MNDGPLCPSTTKQQRNLNCRALSGSGEEFEERSAEAVLHTASDIAAASRNREITLRVHDVPAQLAASRSCRLLLATAVCTTLTTTTRKIRWLLSTRMKPTHNFILASSGSMSRILTHRLRTRTRQGPPAVCRAAAQQAQGPNSPGGWRPRV